MARDPLPVPAAIEIHGPFGFGSWVDSSASILGNVVKLTLGEDVQDGAIVSSFDKIASFRPIENTTNTTFASPSQDLGNLQTPVLWTQSSGPGIWAEVIAPYNRRPASATTTTAMTVTSTFRQGVRIPDFAWGHSRIATGEWEAVYIEGSGENKKQVPYQAIEAQKTANSANTQKKALTKGAWYLTIAHELCGSRHGLAMVNWSFQRLFLQDRTIYIEIASPDDDASDG
jgi:hypothetical protein